MKKLAILLIAFVVFTCGLSAYKLFLVYTHPIKYNSIITKYSNEYNLDAKLVASLINVESSYKPKAKSNKNAIGLMQIKLSTANYLNDLYQLENISENQLFNPETNIKYGCMYLNYLFNKFESIDNAICAYNAGETRVNTWLKNSSYSQDGKTLSNIPYEETKNYIFKIKNNLNFYKKVYN